MKRFKLSMVFLLLSATLLTAQNRTGIVKDAQGEVLPGVSVRVEGKSVGTVTDATGKFSIPAKASDKLVFSFIGMEEKTIDLGSKTDLGDVVMSVDVEQLEDVVVVGYGRMKRSSVAGSITGVKAKEISKVASSNLTSTLAGQMSGVFITQTTGTPGIASNLRIRGSNSWNSSPPLYVIDGIVRDAAAFNVLDPSEVAEISVLKDAASASIYGARASGGVILVTTKKGKAGIPTFVYSANFSVNRPVKVTEMASLYESALISNRARKFAGRPEWAAPDELEAFKKNDPGNWFDAVYRDPSNQRHSLSISGGGEKVKYFVNGSYFTEDGFLKPLQYDRYNVRSNLTIDLTDRLQFGIEFSNENSKRDLYHWEFDYNSADLNNGWGKLLYFFPNKPPYIDGKPVDAWPGQGNLAELLSNNPSTKSYKSNYTNGLFRLTYKVPYIEGLTLSSYYGINMLHSGIETFAKKHTVYQFKSGGTNGNIVTNELIGSGPSGHPSREYLSKSSMKSSYEQFNVQLSYGRTFLKKHTVNATALYEQAESLFEGIDGTRYDFPILVRDQFFATSSAAEDSRFNGYESESGRASYVGRLAYNFSEKYFLTASVRRDGSIKFAPGKRWGWFPAAQVAWQVSKEGFFPKDIVSNLKLRASIGLTGNDAVGGWNWLSKYNPSGDYMFGDKLNKRIRFGGLVNPDLTWEKTREWNVGLDMIVLRDISFSLDYFTRKSYDILGRRTLSVPKSFGATLPAENYGEVSGHGIEMEVRYTKKIAQWTLSAKGVFAYNIAYVDKQDVPENVRDADNPNGKPLGYVKTLKYTKMLRTKEETAEFLAKNPNYTIYGYKPEVGTLLYEDVSGPDGKPDGKVDAYDVQVIKGALNYNPYQFGLFLSAEWKGIFAEILFQGQAGGTKTYTDGYSRNTPVGNRSFAFWNDSWSESNPNAKFPRPAPWGYTRNQYASTFWQRPAGFLRLKRVYLGYTLPKKISLKAGISKLQVYGSATNLGLFFSQFDEDFHDPEVAQMMSYPVMQEYSLGLSITL